MLAELEQILNKMRDEIMEVREQNRVHSRKTTLKSMLRTQCT